MESLTSVAQVGVSLLVGLVVFAAVVHLMRGLLAPRSSHESQGAEARR